MSSPHFSGDDRPWEPVDDGAWARRWIESVQDRALILTGADGAIRWWNAGAALLFGYTDQEMDQQPLTHLCPAESRDLMSQLLLVAEQRGAAERELELVRKDGRRFWGLVNVNPLEVGGQRRYGVAIRDLTERKRAEEALRRSEARYRTTLQSIGDAVIATDAQGQVELLNPIAEQLTGWSNRDAAGRPLEEIFHIANEETLQAVESPVRRVLREGVVVGLANHTVLLRPDGRAIPIADSGAPIRDDQGNITGVVLVFRDQTAERFAQRRREAERRLLEQLARGLDLYQWLELLCREYQQLYPEALASVLLLEGERLRHAAAPDLPDEYNRSVDGVQIGPAVGSCGTAAYYNKSIIVSDITTDPLWDIGRDLALRFGLLACWSIPIRGRKGEVLGTFAVYYRRPRAPTSEERTDLERWAYLASLAIVGHRDREALRESEEKFRLLAEESLAGVYLIQDDRFIYINDAIAQIYGAPREEILSLPLVLNVIAPEDRALVAENLRRRLVGETVKTRYSFRVLRPDGTRRVVEVMGRRILFRGRPAILGTALDITEQYQAQTALQERENFLRSLIRSIDGVVWEADPRTFRFTFVSERAERLLGYPLQQWYDEENFWANHIHPEDRERAVRFCQSATARGEDHHFEYRLVAADGRIVWVQDYVTVEKDEAGRVVRLRGIIVDITDRKRLEIQLLQAQKMEAIGRLAGGIAHDFNNMLTVILGYSQMLLQRLPADDPLREMVQTISDAGQRAATLTQQLLAFSRQTLVEPKLIHLGQFIHDMEKMLRRLIGEDIVLATASAGRLPPVRIDPGQLSQVILNLAVNARDAMPQGGHLTLECSTVELDEHYCRTHPEARPGRHVCLTVSDTGTGMTSEVKERIFEPFFTTKELGRGTGLGLAVVYGIVRQNGGHIEVYSEVGHGTTFKVYLPAAPEQTGTTQPVVEDIPRGHETILLVEDDEAVRGLAQTALQTYGYRVLLAADAMEALRVAEQHAGEIDLLLTDVVMPGMSGRELVEQLRQRLLGLKVLFMSGYTGDAVLRHGLVHAEVAFLQKPFTPASLARKVRDVLDGRS
ncbi:MAG: PAS domain S-box protein [Gemmataceae bacterium]|nr:PAS domain S-box protein [Gemmataceae bacterium]